MCNFLFLVGFEIFFFFILVVDGFGVLVIRFWTLLWNVRKWVGMRR